MDLNVHYLKYEGENWGTISGFTLLGTVRIKELLRHNCMRHVGLQSSFPSFAQRGPDIICAHSIVCITRNHKILRLGASILRLTCHTFFPLESEREKERLAFTP